ncbi:hypothetical protein IW261DRAFT_1421354 [Armillaria novae-zelandiae]|uniref:Uncharacterized protein n=1 Tax=Armillaria novae-zelandiae TaxID=153914 RepID=A0AA39P3G7_9AGAR|nr:hypothetical protein IW261DRAFT_1421354 [Armillaria novae-zelandiae]
MPAFPTPPLHVAPLPSVDSSRTSLLDDYDSSKSHIRVSYGRTRRISIAVIISGILIFITAFHIPREDQYFTNALVALEGTRAPRKLDDGSLESDATMYGLAMSALSAQLVALTVPFLLGLLGYRLASMWNLDSCAGKGAHGIYANGSPVWPARQIMRERRSRAPSILIFAFAILIFALVLNYLLSATDLWLHTTASTFIHTSITEIGTESMPAAGTKINHTTCLGPALSPGSASYGGNCASFVGPKWGDANMVNEGLAVIGNNSFTSRFVMVDDMAVLVPSTMPDNVDNLTFNSFGLVTHCLPVVDCSVDYMVTSLYCPSFNPPLNISTVGELASYGQLDLLDLTNNASSIDPETGYPLDSVLNPSGTHKTKGFPPPRNTPGWYLIFGGLYYGYMSTCNMTAYIVSLSYSTLDGNEGYTFTSTPVLSNFDTTFALFAAFHFYYQTNLFSRNMSYAVMGLASPLFERDVSTGGNVVVLRSASRYPLAPLSAVLAILYTYAFLALVITAFSGMSSSQEITVKKNDGKEHRVTAIELVQLRLTNPLASIAERFSDPARPESLLESSAIDMFHEHPHADKLGVVMGDDGREDGEGMIRRRRTF